MSNLVLILISLVLSFGVMLAIMPAGIALFERLGLGKNIRTE
jgi:hypothetical protein